MRVFIAVLVLIFSLQSWTKADDIRDFQIEGMSLGDSALDYFKKNEIEEGRSNFYPKSKKYYQKTINFNSDLYDSIISSFYSWRRRDFFREEFSISVNYVINQPITGTGNSTRFENSVSLSLILL